MSARPCTVCRSTGSRRPTPGCGYCREAAALRAAARPPTPLQLYRARMRHLAEIADRCGLDALSKEIREAAACPGGDLRRAISWLRWRADWRWTYWRDRWPFPVIGRLLLLSAADETAALLRAKGGAS